MITFQRKSNVKVIHRATVSRHQISNFPPTIHPPVTFNVASFHEIGVQVRREIFQRRTYLSAGRFIRRYW